MQPTIYVIAIQLYAEKKKEKNVKVQLCCIHRNEFSFENLKEKIVFAGLPPIHSNI